MRPIAVIQHQVPGRVRLKVPSRRGDVAYFESVIRTLSAGAAVDELTANPLTGGVVIRHTGSPEPILAAAAEHGVFEARAREAAEAHHASAAAEANAAGLLDAVAASLTGLAGVQLSRGQATGSAVENFWNAFGAHRELHHPGAATMFVLLGLVQLLRGQLLGSASSLLFYALSARNLAVQKSGAGNQESEIGTPNS